MLHVFADSFDTVQSGYVRVPVLDLSPQTPDGGLDIVRANALGSSALTSDASPGRSFLHNDMGIRAIDDTGVATNAILVDQADGFRFPQSSVSSGIVRLPPGSQLSPTQAEEINFIAGVDSSHLIVATSYGAWNAPSNPATYAATSGTAKWGAGAAGTTGGTVTYFFDAASAWTSTEQAVFTGAYALWSDLANIQFAPAADAGSANILIKRGTAGSGAFFSGGSSGSGSPGTVGTTNVWHFDATGAFINIATADSSFGPITADPNGFGGHVWGTIVHEEGHSIGLGHGGPYNSTVAEATQQFSAQDTTLWTIMSYIDPKTATAKYFAEYPVTGTNWGQQDLGGGFFADRSPTTAMMLDIIAAQQLYGAPTTTAYSGGQIYGFNCNIADGSKPFYDFTVNTNPIVTIWNAGTNNTLDLSGFSTASTVNLNAGAFSSCNGMTNNIGIAFNTQINKFVGGTGVDTVTGNNNGDLMDGSFGGVDNFTGGTANDGFYFGAAYLADIVNGGAGSNNQLGLKGDYSGGLTLSGTQITNIQVVALQAGFNYSITTDNALAPTGTTFTFWSVQMTAGQTATINGVAETDAFYKFYLGQGNDTVTGGSAGNLFFGEGGQDSLTGGAGVDTFSYRGVSDSTSTGFDLVRGFTAAQDKFALTGTVVTGVDTQVNGGTLTTAAFDVQLALNVGPLQLAAGHAVLYHATAGDFASDNLWLIVDANGVAGYQASADYVFNVTGGDFTGLATSNFI